MKHSLRAFLQIKATLILTIRDAVQPSHEKSTRFRLRALAQGWPKLGFDIVRRAGSRFASSGPVVFALVVGVPGFLVANSPTAPTEIPSTASPKQPANKLGAQRGEIEKPLQRPMTMPPNGTLQRLFDSGGHALQPDKRLPAPHLPPRAPKRMREGSFGQSRGFTIGAGSGNPIFPTALSYASGGFAYAPGGYEATSVAVGDFNNDGISDLAIVNACADSTCATGSVSIRLGNPDGTFQAAANSYSSGGYLAFGIVVEDFNHDGNLDLAVVNYGSGGGSDGSVGVLPGNGDGTFGAAVLYDSGGVGSDGIAVADFSGDGILDLAVSNDCQSDTVCDGTGPGYVGILVGNGDGSFQPPASYATGGPYAGSVAVGDFNADGHPDLAVANICSDSNCTSGGVSILLNDGQGHFPQVALYLSGGLTTNSVATGDLNGDGHTDVALANICADSNCTNGSVGVLLNNGDGTFQTAKSYDSGGQGARSVEIGDFNGDGKSDLALANLGQCGESGCTSSSVGILLQNSDGTFGPASTFAPGGLETFFLTVADFNRDGKQDLAVVDNCNDGDCTESTVGVLLGNGDGTFQTDTTYQTSICCHTGTTGAYSVAVGDFNGDGKPDLAVSNQCADISCVTGSVSVFIGNGDGTYQPAVNYRSSGWDTSAVAVGDFNGDHIVDIALVDQCSDSTCSSGSGSVSVLLGKGDGTFGPAAQFLSAAQYSDSIAVGDFNKDGKLDLAVGNYTICGDGCQVGTVGVLLGNGDGSFQTATVYNSGGIQASSVAVADLNHDGYPDLAVANPCADVSCGSGGLVGILLNKGDGTGTFQPVVGYASGGYGAESLAIGDLNGDGTLDLAVANASAAPGNIGVLLGDGHGSFGAAQTFPVDGQPLSVAIGDLNGDGIPDLAFASYELCDNNGCDSFDGAVGVLLGSGNGIFQSAVDYAQGSLVGYALIATDLNGDYKPDLAVVRDGSLTAFLNIVSGYRFGTTTTLMSSLNPAPQFQAVSFTATVAGPQGQGGTPTGDVTFYDGSTALGTAPLNGGQPDQASFTTSSLGVGKNSITANYAGDGNFLPSVSAPLIQVITAVPPKITAQPTSPTINYNQTATLAVVAIGTPPLSYQWYLGRSPNTSTPIAGATNSSYTTPALTTTTDYWVQVSNAEGKANSTTAIVTVNPPPTITTTSLPNGAAGTAYAQTLQATGGTQPYAWSITVGSLPAGLALNGSSGAISGIPLAVGGSNFTVQVTDANSNKASQPLSIQIVSPVIPPTITTQPSSQMINRGQAATMTVGATGTAPLSYQWYQGVSPDTASPVSGATSASFTTPALTTSTSFWVRVSNTAGIANSNTATITVDLGPMCILMVQGNSNPLTFTVTAKCTDAAATITSTTINWGDGTELSGTGGSHTYANVGAFTITVTAIDTLELVGSTSESVTAIQQPPQSTFAGQSSSAPVTVIPPPQSVGVTVTFDCISVTGPGLTGSVTPDSLGISCSSSPVKLVANTNTVPVNISTTGAAAARMTSPVKRVLPLYALWLPLPGFVFLGLGISGRAPNRRKVLRYLTLALLSALVVLLVSCGGGFTQPPSTRSQKQATPAGTYFVTLVDTPVQGATTSFVQTSLIVPLTVSATQ